MSDAPSIRQLANQLGLSVATVSMALRQETRIRSETAKRLTSLAGKLGYNPAPVVSEGLSHARRRSFYRETLV